MFSILKISFLKKKNCTCHDFRGTDVDFRKFLDENLMEVPSLSLCKHDVSLVIETKS
jgi:hypothetical protein